MTRRVSTRHSPATACRVLRSLATPDTAGVHRGEFALVALFKFHSVSLGGRLYPLPRRTTFRLRNVLHLMEARNRVAHVRGIFQRLLALLRKSERGCGYLVTSCLGELCHCFPPRQYLPAPGIPRDSLPRITATFLTPAAWCD